MVIILEEVKQFMDTLDKPILAQLWRIIGLLEQFQFRLGMPYSKHLDRNLYELRLKGKIAVRITYTFRQENIVLFYGFIKKSQRIPKNELRTIYQKFIRLQQ